MVDVQIVRVGDDESDRIIRKIELSNRDGFFDSETRKLRIFDVTMILDERTYQKIKDKAQELGWDD